MKPSYLLPLCVSLLLPWAPVHAGKSCEELKAEIDGKLKSNGVQNYVLEIMPKEAVQDGKIVGSCEGATKKITYSRTTDSNTATASTADATTQAE